MYTLEAEFVEQARRAVEIPRAEARARLLRELELTDPKRRLPRRQRRPVRAWISAAWSWLGDGLAAAGIRPAGRGGGVL